MTKINPEYLEKAKKIAEHHTVSKVPSIDAGVNTYIIKGEFVLYQREYDDRVNDIATAFQQVADEVRKDCAEIAEKMNTTVNFKCICGVGYEHYSSIGFGIAKAILNSKGEK